MSDGVVVALITVVGSIIVAVITAILSRKPTQHPPIHVSVADRDRDKVEPPLVADRIDRSVGEVKKEVITLATVPVVETQQHAPQSASVPRKESPVLQPADDWEAIRSKWPIFLKSGEAMLDKDDIPHINAIIDECKEYLTNVLVDGNDWKNCHLESFHKLHRLEKLEISLCKQLRDEALVYIGRCKSLRHLDLSTLSSEASTRLTGAALRQLAKLTNLELLELPGMLNPRDASMKEAVRYLKAQLPNCVIKYPGLSL